MSALTWKPGRFSAYVLQNGHFTLCFDLDHLTQITLVSQFCATPLSDWTHSSDGSRDGSDRSHLSGQILTHSVHLLVSFVECEVRLS
jgi:hypothetical protein